MIWIVFFLHYNQLQYILTYPKMNVVRDLRNTITHLQAEVERKQKLIVRQQQQYQQIICSLQNENQRLKQLLQQNSMTNKGDEFFKSSSQIHNESPSRISAILLDHKEANFNLSTGEYVDIVNENIFLKNQISELSTTYQKQIDQLVFYFEKIKQENKRISPAHYSGQLALVMNWVKTFIKDFHHEKQKYSRKLLECGETLQLYENKIIQLEQIIQKLKLQLKLNQQKRKIIGRNLL